MTPLTSICHVEVPQLMNIRMLWLCLVASSLLGVAGNALAAQSPPLPLAKPEAVGMSSQRLAQIAVALQSEIDRKTMPGAVLAIARRGKLVYYEAFGKLSDEAPAPIRQRLTTCASPRCYGAAAALTQYAFWGARPSST